MPHNILILRCFKSQNFNQLKIQNFNSAKLIFTLNNVATNNWSRIGILELYLKSHMTILQTAPTKGYPLYYRLSERANAQHKTNQLLARIMTNCILETSPLVYLNNFIHKQKINFKTSKLLPNELFK